MAMILFIHCRGKGKVVRVYYILNPVTVKVLKMLLKIFLLTKLLDVNSSKCFIASRFYLCNVNRLHK